MKERREEVAFCGLLFLVAAIQLLASRDADGVSFCSCFVVGWVGIACILFNYL